MQAKRVDRCLADPRSELWDGVAAETVRLAPVPLEAQPTGYIRAAWAGRPYGLVKQVKVAAAHDGASLYVRLEWADSPNPNTEFPDAAGVFFPPFENWSEPSPQSSPASNAGEGDLSRMRDFCGLGVRAAQDRSSDQSDPAAVMQASDGAVELWYWQANRDGGELLTAHGPGVFRTCPNAPPVTASATLADGRWSVVLSRAFDETRAPGSAIRFGVTVWDGSNEERAGIGAVTPQLLHLEIAAALARAEAAS